MLFLNHVKFIHIMYEMQSFAHLYCTKNAYCLFHLTALFEYKTALFEYKTALLEYIDLFLLDVPIYSSMICCTSNQDL